LKRNAAWFVAHLGVAFLFLCAVNASAQHACGPGRTHAHLRRARVQNLRMFPNAAQWREWLGL